MSFSSWSIYSRVGHILLVANFEELYIEHDIVGYCSWSKQICL
jgi:hypothetical protein